jgi:DNA-directed RNA polymerase specialized sigma24 family protein
VSGDRARLEQAVVASRGELIEFLGRHAPAALLRFETPEDLAQGVASEALASADRFTWEGEPQTRAWLFRVARRHVADRTDHWMALKRRSGPLLRLDATRTGSAGGGTPEPAITQTGPSTFAFRREQLRLTTKALALLLPRDRDLVTWASEGVPLAEQAERLGIAYRAVSKAGQRAFDRFRKTYELVSRADARSRRG